MKRYLAFRGHVYYPSGGMRDFVGDFDLISEAQDAIIKTNNPIQVRSRLAV